MSLPWARWNVQPAQHVLCRVGKIVLDEAHVDAGVAVSAFLKSLQEKPARVLVAFGLEEQNLR